MSRPFEIELEPSFGCNRKCEFCGNFTFGWKSHGMMTLDTAERTARGIGEFGKLRVTIAGRGEPTLNKDWAQIVAIVRAYCPEVQITLITNRANLIKDVSADFWSAGGNYILLDDYDNVSGIPRGGERDNPWQFISNTRIGIVNLDNPYNGEPLKRQFTTRCGAVDPRVYKKYGMNLSPVGGLNKKCDKPFRRIDVRWDGGLGLCCMDWLDAGRLSSIYNVVSLQQWWERDKELYKIRKRLLNRDRNFSPCNRCDFTGGYRLGFLHMEDFEHGT